MKYLGQRALIVGVGKSGLSAARFLARQGADVIATDLAPAEKLVDAVHELESFGIYGEFGGYNRATFMKSDFIVLSPGVNPDSTLIREAVHNGVEVVNEPELAFREITIPVIAVTGSNGKTTTTTMIGEILRASGHRVFVGGNIGVPLLDYVNGYSFGHGHSYGPSYADDKGTGSGKAGAAPAYDVVVAELSSYQIELIRSLRPAVAVFTNISQNHLDRYKTIERYTDAKHGLRKLCGTESVLVLNADDSIVAGFSAGAAVGEVREFSSAQARGWIHAQGSAKNVQLAGGELFDLTNFKLPGMHNVENLMAAIAATWTLKPQGHVAAREISTARETVAEPRTAGLPAALGATFAGIESVIASFAGVSHRIEFVREFAGVRYFNDSKSTTVQSLLTCLNGFGDHTNIVLIGGRDKGSDYKMLISALNQKSRAVIVFGEARNLIAAQLSADEKLGGPGKPTWPLWVVAELGEAIARARELAQSGDCVLLSPACASQDQFRNFEDRGDFFKRVVLEFT